MSKDLGALQIHVVDTSVGRAVYASDRPFPSALMLHGFYRSPQHLIAWRERIPGAGFLYLPGHAGAPAFSEVSLDLWIRGFGEVLATFPEPPVLVAESLGAMVALGLRARAVVAVEPLLSVHQLWPLHQTISRLKARGGAVDPALEAIFARPFHWILARVSAPTLVLAGDEPLLPPRPVPREPSVLTDEDLAVYADHPRVVAALRIAGGHTLLDHSRDEVMRAAASFLGEHGVRAAANATEQG